VAQLERGWWQQHWQTLLLDSYPFVFEKELMAGVVKVVMVGGAAERSWLRRVACVTWNLETVGEGGRNAAAGERQPKEREKGECVRWWE
jgi:hypothetical protein